MTKPYSQSLHHSLTQCTFLFHFQLPVSVYYESLCPDSKAFIVEQLTPTLQGPLGKFVTLTLVPYGKSSVSRNK